MTIVTFLAVVCFIVWSIAIYLCYTIARSVQNEFKRIHAYYAAKLARKERKWNEYMIRRYIREGKVENG